MLEFWLDPDSAYFKQGKLDMNKKMGFEKIFHIDGGFASMKNSGFKIT